MTAPPVATADLPGPPWLAERRRAAAARLGRPELPSTDEEVWRYSRVADLDLDDWTPVARRPAGGLPAEVAELLEALPPGPPPWSSATASWSTPRSIPRGPPRASTQGRWATAPSPRRPWVRSPGRPTSSPS